jgi:uncharacterized membrane protein YtjA (UPF0391 family)
LRNKSCRGDLTLPTIRERLHMLKWALIFFVVSIIAGALGFSGIAAGTARIAKILFVIAVAIFLIFLVLAIMAGEAII